MGNVNLLLILLHLTMKWVIMFFIICKSVILSVFSDCFYLTMFLLYVKQESYECWIQYLIININIITFKYHLLSVYLIIQIWGKLLKRSFEVPVVVTFQKICIHYLQIL